MNSQISKLPSMLIILILICNFSYAQTSNDVDTRVDSVMSLMTLQEKIGQLNQLSYGFGWGPNVKNQIAEEYQRMVRDGKIGSFLNAAGYEVTYELQKIAVEESRLKIPLIFGLDVIHGYKSIFPVPIAEASTWDPEYVELSARISALEAAASGVHWTFAPMVDIARDPRWGRIVEGSGEDHYLGSVMAKARVRGFQGDLSDDNIIACAKHYAAYGGAEGGRDYNTVEMSERTLRDFYLPPYKAAVEEGVFTLMASFNEISGVPSSGSKFLMNDILRDEWNFKGFVVSDWNSVGELVPHGVAADLKDAAELGLKAGVDMDMEARAYISNVEKLIEEKKLSLELLDESVRRILRVKFILGLFDNPFKYNNKEKETKTILSNENQNATFEVAKRSIVLLKNDGILPLQKDKKNIALIGPLAKSNIDPLGSWFGFGDSSNVISLYEGLVNYLGSDENINYSFGCPVDSADRSGFSKALEAAKSSELIILALGEYGSMSGEARSRSTIELPGVQEELFNELKKLNKPIVVVLMNGRPLAIPNIDKNANAILESWFLGNRAGDAIASVLFGDYNPSGKLPVTFPYSTGQIPNYYNFKNTGRPFNPKDYFTAKYIDISNSPLYPFGFGLSYTEFEYSNLVISNNKLTKSDKLIISVDVENIGSYDGEEVVQLYIRDLVGSVTRPVKELKGFNKIELKKGQKKTVSFELTEKDLRFYDINMKYTSEPGKFKVFVGTNSIETLENEFELF